MHFNHTDLNVKITSLKSDREYWKAVYYPSLACKLGSSLLCMNTFNISRKLKLVQSYACIVKFLLINEISVAVQRQKSAWNFISPPINKNMLRTKISDNFITFQIWLLASDIHYLNFFVGPLLVLHQSVAARSCNSSINCFTAETFFPPTGSSQMYAHRCPVYANLCPVYAHNGAQCKPIAHSPLWTLSVQLVNC